MDQSAEQIDPVVICYIYLVAEQSINKVAICQAKNCYGAVLLDCSACIAALILASLSLYPWSLIASNAADLFFTGRGSAWPSDDSPPKTGFFSHSINDVFFAAAPVL